LPGKPTPAKLASLANRRVVFREALRGRVMKHRFLLRLGSSDFESLAV
jgi:hypothetical protein